MRATGTHRSRLFSSVFATSARRSWLKAGAAAAVVIALIAGAITATTVSATADSPTGESGPTMRQVAASGSTFGLGLDSAGQVWRFTSSTKALDSMANAFLASNHVVVQQLYAGSQDAFALLTNGSVISWPIGGNSSDEFELGRTWANNVGYVKVGSATGANLTGVVQMDAGYGHVLALTSTHAVYGWGQSGFGELSDFGAKTYSTVYHENFARLLPATAFSRSCLNTSVWPIKTTVTTFTPTQVAVGADMSVVLDSTGAIWTMGRRVDGIHLGTYEQSTSPYTDTMLEKTFWGQNLATPAQVVTSNTQAYNLTTCADSAAIFKGVTKVKAGAFFGLAIKGGQVYGWGDNSYGELGQGTIATTVQPASYPTLPVLTAPNTPLANVADIEIGGYSSFAITTDGTLYSWGMNTHGELGQGTVANSAYAKPVLNFDRTVNGNAPFKPVAGPTTTGAPAVPLAVASYQGQGAALDFGALFITTDRRAGQVSSTAAYAGSPYGADAKASSTAKPQLLWKYSQQYQITSAPDSANGPWPKELDTNINFSDPVKDPSATADGKLHIGQAPFVIMDNPKAARHGDTPNTDRDNASNLGESYDPLAQNFTSPSADDDAYHAVNYTSSTPGVCTMVPTGNGGYTVTVITSGNCTITRSTVSNTHVALPVQARTFVIPKYQQIIAKFDPANTDFPFKAVNVDTPPIVLPTTTDAPAGIAVTYTAGPANVCKIQSGKVVVTGALGDCTVTASNAGNGSYEAYSKATKFTVTPAKNVQSVPGLSAVLNGLVYGAPAVALPQYTDAVDADGNSLKIPVVYTATGDCTVDTSVTPTTLTSTGAGSCVVTTSAAGADKGGEGDRGYLPLSGSATATIAKAPTTVTIPPALAGMKEEQVSSELSPSAALPLTAQEGQPVTWSVSDDTKDNCSVDPATGIVTTNTIEAPANCTLVATTPGTANYIALSTTYTFPIEAKDPQTLSGLDAAVAGARFGGGPYALPQQTDEGQPVTYTVSPDSAAVCKIEGTPAKLVILAAGNCDVSAAAPGTGTLKAFGTGKSYPAAKSPQNLSATDQGNGEIPMPGLTGLKAGSQSRPLPSVTEQGVPIVWTGTTGVCEVQTDPVTHQPFLAMTGSGDCDLQGVADPSASSDPAIQALAANYEVFTTGQHFPVPMNYDPIDAEIAIGDAALGAGGTVAAAPAGGYTAASVKAYQDELAKAKTLAQQDTSKPGSAQKQDELDAELLLLQAAKDALVPVSDLAKAVDTANGYGLPDAPNGDYTAASWADFTAKRDAAAAVLASAADENQAVTAAQVATALSDLTTAQQKLIDLSKLRAADTDANTISTNDAGLYTPDTWAEFLAARDAAGGNAGPDGVDGNADDVLGILDKATDPNLMPPYTQQNVDDATARLVAAQAALEKRPDKSKLQAETSKDNADALNSANYTAGSWKIYNDALTAAQATLDNPNATQKQVDDALKALQDARADLVTTSALAAAVSGADAVDAADYGDGTTTDPDWVNFADKLSDAQKVIDDAKIASNDVTQADVDKALADLGAARDALTASRQTLNPGLAEVIGDPAVGGDPIALPTKSDQGGDLTYDVGSSAGCSVSGTTLTITDAGTCTITAHAAATTNGEFDARDFPAVPIVVTRTVTALADDIADGKTKQEKDYTPASWVAFEAALAAANSHLPQAKDPHGNVTQAQTDGVDDALTAAQAALVEKGDKTALQKFVDDNAAIDQTHYTADSWDAYTTALNAAKVVLADPNADQTAVDDALATLTKGDNSGAFDKLVDLSPLAADVDADQRLNKDAYVSPADTDSQGLWDTFQDKLADAQAVLADPAATAAEVKDAEDALQAARDALHPQKQTLAKGDLYQVITSPKVGDVFPLPDQTVQGGHLTYTLGAGSAGCELTDGGTKLKITSLSGDGKECKLLADAPAVTVGSDTFDAVQFEYSAEIVNDPTALDAAIAKATGIVNGSGDYTQGSLDALKAALADAQNARSNDGSVQSDYDTATAAVNDAIAALVDRSGLKDRIDQAIADAQAKENSGDYSTESKDTLDKAISDLQKLYDDNDPATDLTDYNAAISAVDDAENDLLDIGALGDKIQQAIDAANATLGNGDYTGDTAAAVTQAISDLQDQLDTINAGHDPGDTSTTLGALKTAEDGLIDLGPLRTADASGRALDPDDWAQDAAWTAFNAPAPTGPLANAEAVLADPHATAQQVADALKAINDGRAALTAVRQTVDLPGAVGADPGYGDAITLPATSDQGGAIVYTAGPTDACVVQDGKLVIIGAGACTVTGSISAAGGFPARDVSYTFTPGAGLLLQLTINDVRIDGDDVPVGTDLFATGVGLEPGSTATVTLHSDPVVLGTGIVDPSGNVRIPVTIPLNTALGAHTLIASGISNLAGHATLTRSANVNVTALPALAFTGASVVAPVIAALALLTAGGIAIGLRWWQPVGGKQRGRRAAR